MSSTSTVQILLKIYIQFMYYFPKQKLPTDKTQLIKLDKQQEIKIKGKDKVKAKGKAEAKNKTKTYHEVIIISLLLITVLSYCIVTYYLFVIH